MSPKTTKAQNSKVLGDAAEYYALSQFAFAGRPGTKMPDNWEGYDLAVETGTEKGQGTGLQRVSVKLRTESDGWKAASWFMFDDGVCRDRGRLFVSTRCVLDGFNFGWDT